MKVFVVLALAVFTGCNANLVWENQQSRQQVDMVKDAFWTYVTKASTAVEESLREFRRSGVGNEMSTLLDQSRDAINTFADSVRDQAGPISQEMVSRVSQEAERLKTRVDADLTVLRKQMQPYAEEVVAEVRTRVQELKREVEPYTGPLDGEVLMQKSAELREQLDRSIEQLQAEMIPLAEQMKVKVQQSVEELQTSMASVGSQLNLNTQEFQGSLVQLGEELKAKMNTDTKVLRKQLKNLWKSFMEMTQ